MRIEAAIASYLASQPDLVQLIGDRIYPVKLPQDPAMPAVTYQRISTVPVKTLDGPNPAHQRVRLQFSCWGEDVPGRASGYASAKAVAAQIRKGLQDHRGSMGGIEVLYIDVEGERDLYEDETDSYHVPIDVIVTHKGGDI